MMEKNDAKDNGEFVIRQRHSISNEHKSYKKKGDEMKQRLAWNSGKP